MGCCCCKTARNQSEDIQNATRRRHPIIRIPEPVNGERPIVRENIYTTSPVAKTRHHGHPQPPLRRRHLSIDSLSDDDFERETLPVKRFEKTTSITAGSFEADILTFISEIIENDSDDFLERKRKLDEATKLLEDLRKDTNNSGRASKNNEVLVSLEASGIDKSMDLNCPICMENFKNRRISATACGHLFCEECITMFLESNDFCPTCRKNVDFNSVRTIYL